MSTDETWTLGNSINGHTLKPGQQWHRKDFTREMLPEPYRPMLLGEMAEQGDHIIWRDLTTDDTSPLPRTCVMLNSRTTRPLPDHVGEVNEMITDHSPDVGKMVELEKARAVLLREAEEWKARAEQELVQKAHQLRLWMKRCLAAEGQIVAQQNRAEKAERHCGNLLAVMHSDGGHYQSEHGTDKAVADAIAKWYQIQECLDQQTIVAERKEGE